MKRVAVVILNYNGQKMLADFLPCVIENTNADMADIIVADNKSTDGSVEFMREVFPDIRLILNDENYGFAGGYNKALEQVEAEYYVLLNSDIEVSKGWIEPIIAFMDENRDVAACQPKIRSYYEREKFEYAGAAGGFIDKYGYPFCRGRVFQNLETDNGQYDTTMDVFWATGACMFVRADLYREMGGLDASFFAHMEEIDLCWRLKNAGYRICCCPQSTVFHIGGGTLPKNSPRKTFLNFRNNLSLLLKNYPGGKVYLILFYRIFLDWVAAMKFLLGGCPADFAAVINAHFAFYSRRKDLMRTRHGLKKAPLSNVYNKNIVYQSFVRGVKTYSELSESDFL